MKTNSFYDTRGALWVACTECKRGYNGYQSCTGAILQSSLAKGVFVEIYWKNIQNYLKNNKNKRNQNDTRTRIERKVDTIL